MECMATMLAKGANAALKERTYGVRVRSGQAALDTTVLILGANAKVLSDAHMVFYGNPRGFGVHVQGAECQIDLEALPAEAEFVVIGAGIDTGSDAVLPFTEAMTVSVTSASEAFETPPTAPEPGVTFMRVAEVYRRNGQWKLRPLLEGWASGLAGFATEYGVDVDSPAEAAAPAPQQSPPPADPPISFEKVRISLDKGQKASIDLRKGRGRNYRLETSLEWDGRGATYNPDGTVKRYGEGDLDVYFFCRDEQTNAYVVISGDTGHLGSLETWPFARHTGDSRGATRHAPGHEDVHVIPVENGQLLVNVYQSVDNGSGAIDHFGRPRVVVRYGEVGPGSHLTDEADAITVPVGNTRDSYWANVARIDVEAGQLIVENTNLYSAEGSESMPVLDSAGGIVMNPVDGPVGRSKERNRGQGLTRYDGVCPAP